MPRPRGIKKTIDEKIEEKELLIRELSEKLEREKSELKVLLEKQKEQRTSQILSLMDKNNLSIEDIEEILLQHFSQSSTEHKVVEQTVIEIAG